MPDPTGSPDWWRDAVVYQIYPRSFADANGDGVGDLPGLIARLDYLDWLGVEAIWLNPVTPSPNADWGYDVADYVDVDEALGTLDDLDRLVAEAGARGIRVLLDIVPNHTSDRHPWFLDARSGRDARHRDWYVWADGRDAGEPPNNWTGSFGGAAWTWDERTEQWYLHNFLPQQPDLNWWNEEVREEFERILRFWFDRGVAGFRIDVANALVKDRDLRDNPLSKPDDHRWERKHGQRRIYNANRPEVHEVYARWRELADGYDPPRLLVGEAWVHDPGRWARFYGSGDDELDLAFNFQLLDAPFEVDALRAAVEATEAALPEGAVAAITASNHDVVRFPTRWCGGDAKLVRCALLLLLTLRGTPMLYYGDELGLPQTPIPAERVLDVAGRDGARTPMPWSDEPGGGFTAADVEPWLPFGDLAGCNVAGQRGDGDSALELARALIRLRRDVPELRRGPYESVPAPPGVWAWRRGGVLVAVNLSAVAAALAGVEGSVRLGTVPGRAGEAVRGSLALAPAEGAVVLA
jgi:alpha-glucosidase